MGSGKSVMLQFLKLSKFLFERKDFCLLNNKKKSIKTSIGLFLTKKIQFLSKHMKPKLDMFEEEKNLNQSLAF